MEKLYVVVREDLPPGPQAVQSVHAAIQFVHEHPEIEGRWYAGSNHLALLSVADEAALRKLLRRAEARGLATSRFHEPDLGGQLTAAAFEPGDHSGRVLRRLGLTLRDP